MPLSLIAEAFQVMLCVEPVNVVSGSSHNVGEIDREAAPSTITWKKEHCPLPGDLRWIKVDVLRLAVNHHRVSTRCVGRGFGDCGKSKQSKHKKNALHD